MGIFSKKKDAQEKIEKEKSDIKSKKTEKSVKVDNDKTEKSTKDSKKVKTDEKKITKDTSKEETVKKNGNAYKVLVKPLITEKATEIGAFNKYVFEVDKNANKIEIAKAINEVYGVKPLDINIIRMKGKKVRYGRTLGKKKDWKKAIVTLEEGKSIKIYEGV